MAKTVLLLLVLTASFAALAGQSQISAYTDWHLAINGDSSVWDMSYQSVKHIDATTVSFQLRQRPTDLGKIALFRSEYLKDLGINAVPAKYEHLAYGIDIIEANCTTMASRMVTQLSYDDSGRLIDSNQWDSAWKETKPESGLGHAIIQACVPPSECGKIDGTEYGSPSELKGIHSLYVETDTDLELRANIIKEIRKKHPELIISDNVDVADVVLVFSAHLDTYLAGYHSSTTGTVDSSSGNVDATTTTSPRYRSVITGTGLIMRFTKTCHARYLMSFGDKKSMIFERRPSTNFARAFVKAYEEANGLGNKR